MTFRRRQNNDYSYDAYNNNNNAYNGNGGPNTIRLGDSLGLNNSLGNSVNIGPYGTSHDARPTYNGLVNGGTSVLDWPVQSDVYGTIGSKPAPLTMIVPKTVIEDQHQTVHVPRTVVDTATKTVSVPRTVMDKKSRMIQEPRTIYEQKDEEYKVPRTVIEQETRIIQVPRTVYDEQRITVNVPKTVYESHLRKVTVPKTIIHEREEYYEVPRQVIENKEVNYEVARTVYDTKTTVVQVPRTVMETKIIEAKPVTYHVTKYVYPNVNGATGDIAGFNEGFEGLNQTSFEHTGYRNSGYHHPGGELAAILPDARKTSYNPVLGTTTTYHNHSGANGTSAGVYGNKPYSSSGPYNAAVPPRFNGNHSNEYTSSSALFPSFAPVQPQAVDLFRAKSPLRQSAYYQNGVLTLNR